MSHSMRSGKAFVPTATQLDIVRKMLDAAPVPSKGRHVDFVNVEARVLAYYMEPKPMFSKQHYDRIAALLNAQRRKIKTDGMIDDAARAVELRALNDVVIGFVQLLKTDQPKFRELQFIGACDNEAAPETDR